jgi:hypothetical protein
MGRAWELRISSSSHDDSGGVCDGGGKLSGEYGEDRKSVTLL